MTPLGNYVANLICARHACPRDALGLQVGDCGRGPGVTLRKADAKPASIPLEDLNAENDE